MARAKSELRPCLADIPKLGNFAPDPPKHTIGKFMRQFDQLSDGGARRNPGHVDLLFACKTDSTNRCNESPWSV
jgi:hypothetical protein